MNLLTIGLAATISSLLNPIEIVLAHACAESLTVIFLFFVCFDNQYSLQWGLHGPLLSGFLFLLQSTCAVLTYKPDSKENPFSCGLEGLEVFSCGMSAEEDTALSIVDPSTVNIELKGNSSHIHSGQQLGGLLDIMDAHAVLEVKCDPASQNHPNVARHGFFVKTTF